MSGAGSGQGSLSELRANNGQRLYARQNFNEGRKEVLMMEEECWGSWSWQRKRMMNGSMKNTVGAHGCLV